jgi:hypothetical protein
MKDDAKDELKKILLAYDDRIAESARVEAANRAAQVAFPERYSELRRDTIRPVMQEFVDVLNGRGHEGTLREAEESSTTEGGIKLAAITLRVVPKALVGRATATNKSFVEISFSANRSEQKITVSSTNTMINSAGNVGKRGEYPIDAVTVEVVEAHILQTLREALIEARHPREAR